MMRALFPDRLKAALLFGWLLLPTLSVLATSQLPDGLAVLALLVFAVLVLAFPLIFIARVRWYFMLWMPLALLVAPYCALTLLYGSVPGDALVAATLNTGLKQALQVVLSFGWPVLLVPASALLYGWGAWSLSRGWVLAVEARKRLAAALLMFIFAAMVARMTLSQYIRLPPFFDQSTTSLAFPSGLLSSLARVLKEKENSEDFASVAGQAAAGGPLLVVLVIGESVRYDHLGINGYPRDTTPRLAALGKQVLSFSNMASCCNWTAAAVPAIVTRGLGAKRASLVRTFGEAGFSTAWISNQEPSPFAADANVAEFATNTRDFHYRKDADLLPIFTSFVRQAGARQFVVLHLYGSHIPYEEQYDAASRKYTPTMSDLGVGTPLPRDKQAAINSYDNTIVELDALMGRVIGTLQQETRPAVLVFVSDHGENLFDDERGIFMHAQNPPTRHDTHVPLLVWMNNDYRSSFARQADALQSHLRSKISHANMFPTMLDLAGVAWQGADPRQSIAAPQFTEGPRPVRGIGIDRVEFDTLR